jgi:hypothetical protein
VSLEDLLDSDLLRELLEWIVSGDLLELDGSVLIDELVDGHVTTTDANLDLVLDDLHLNTLGSKPVDTGALTHEHDLELGSVRVVVDVLSDFHVNGIVTDGHVDGEAGFELDDVALEMLELFFVNANLLQEVKTVLVGGVDLILESSHILRGGSQVGMQLLLVSVERANDSFEPLFLNLDALDKSLLLANLLMQAVDL